MNQRVEERLTNERSFSRYNERLEEAWQPHEARIIREQARKDAQQEQATRDAAKAIIMFEKQEAERNPWIAASKMTAMQGVDKRAEENKVEKWANTLPIGMNRNQPTDEYIGYLPYNSGVTPWGLGTSSILAMNGRERVMPTTAGIGSLIEYDPMFNHKVYEALRTDESAMAIWEEAKGVLGDVLLDQIFNIIILLAPPNLRMPIYVYMLLDGFCQCAKTLRDEAVKKYKEEHHCSEEEARRKSRYDKELLIKICTRFFNEGLNHILGKWKWLPSDIQSILNSMIKSIADRLVECMAEQVI